MASFELLLPNNFLESEVRCEYSIDSDMKKVWCIQLRILYEFINVCEKNNLMYWLFGGSLIGAVRHKGYIPWDDDIDVIMPRKDYDILCSHPEWFSGDVALHISNNKEMYYEGWARVHYLKSAVLYPNYKKAGSKQGIYLDVFPLDYATQNDRKNRKKIKRINAIGHAICYNCNPSFLTRFVCTLNMVFRFWKPEKLFKKINKLSKSDIQTEKMMFKVCTVYPFEKNIFDSNDFKETIIVPFEFLNVAVPKNYDNILKTMYGDWRAFPPKEKRGAWHNFIFSTDKPFNEFNRK